MKKTTSKKKKATKAPKKKKTATASKKKKAAPAKKKKTATKAKKKSKPVAKRKAAPVKKKKTVAVKKKKVAAPKAKKAVKTKSKEKFPGYPQYPAGQDIMNRKEMKKTVLDEENRRSLDDKKALKTKGPKKQAELFDEEPRRKKSTDVSKEEIDLIDSDNLNADMGDDEDLKKRPWPVDMEGEDLDVPGSELDDDSEDIGAEDEENNSYSIGGDRHDDLEEDKDLGQ